MFVSRFNFLRSFVPKFKPAGYARLWGLSQNADGTISGSASSDTGKYAVKYGSGTPILYSSGDGFSEALVDESGNNLAVVARGNATVSTSQSVFGGASGYFDGVTGSTITAPASDAFEFSDGDFTVECWVRFESLPSDDWATFVTYGNASDPSAAPRWLLYMDTRSSQSAPGLRFSAADASNSSAFDFSQGDSSGWQADQWYHVAVTRSGSTARLFLDGAVVATGTLSGALASAGASGQLACGAELLNAYGKFDGFIDELRIVKGTALYTANFTPPTGPLGVYPPPAASTSLLLNFDGADGSQSFTDSSGNALTVTANGNAVTSTAQSKFGGASGCFATANNDYLETTSPELLLENDDFTIEFWVRPTSLTGSIVGNRDLPQNILNNDAVWQILFWEGSGSYVLNWHTQGTIVLAANAPVAANEWSHVAFVRNNSNLTVYINGVASGIASDSRNYNEDHPLLVFRDGSTYHGATGYIDDLRIVKGAALYTANFTPPTGPLGVYPPPEASTSLLLHFDATPKGKRAFEVYPAAQSVEDAGGTGVSGLCVGNAEISTAQSKWGGSSLYIPSTGGNLAIASGSVAAFGTDDFTIECWWYPLSLSQNMTILGPRDSSSTFMFGYYPESNFGLVVIAPGVGVLLGSTDTASLNQWNHIAVSRLGGTVRLFLNGSLVAAETLTNNFYINEPTIGDNLSTTQIHSDGIDGYIDDFRIVKGAAIYADEFTPPIAPLAVVTGTSLLFNFDAFSVIPYGQFDGFDVSGNSLKQIRAEDLSLATGEAGDISDNLLSSSSLDQFYTDLDVGSGTLQVQGNPGILDDHPTIAAAKGYEVLGSDPTSLLLHFDGSDGSTTFTDSSPNNLMVTANGDAAISTSQSKFGGASAHFDGDGDYLELADAPTFEFGSGDFTVEAWMYIPSSVPAADMCLVSKYLANTTADASSWMINIAASIGLVGINWCIGGTEDYTYTDIPAPYTDRWIHVAFVRGGGMMTLYWNGTAITSKSVSGSLNDVGEPIRVGARAYQNEAPDLNFNGYIDELRITKGYALYTSNFTPPDLPFGAETSLLLHFDGAETSLLLHFDGADNDTTTTDSGQNNFGVTFNGGATISTAQSKWGGSSLHVPANGYLSVSNNAAFDFGTGDFTIECWFRPSSMSVPIVIGLIGGSHIGCGSWSLAFCQDGVNGISGGNAIDMLVTCALFNSPPIFHTVADNTWQHIAVTRSSGIVRFFQDGVLLGSRTDSTDYSLATDLYIGNAPGVIYGNDAYIDELRIIKGYAAYTSNFIPPAAPF